MTFYLSMAHCEWAAVALRGGRVLEKYGVLVGAGTFNGKLYELGGFPGAVASIIPQDLVKGELFQLDNPAVLLPFLDKYEGCTGALVSAWPGRGLTRFRRRGEGLDLSLRPINLRFSNH